MKKEEAKHIKRISLLIACASALQLAESLIPSPFPGIKLGLANMITLVVLVNLGFKASVEVAVLRTVISSFIMGTFLSPTFILSFSGALASSLIMGIFYKLFTLRRKIYFSIVSISVIGSVAHILVQISLVYFLLIKHNGVFLLLPWLGISAVVMGWITGLAAAKVCSRLKSEKVPESHSSIDTAASELKSKYYINEKSPLHSLLPVIKISGILFLALMIIFLNNVLFYIVMMFFLLALAYLSKIPFLNLFAGIKKLSTFIFFSFFIPVFFTKSGEVLLNLNFLQITEGGILTGSIFVFRIILLMLNASLLISTTSPDELASGLSKCLSPLNAVGIDGNRTAQIITLSWVNTPIFWEKSTRFIKSHKLDRRIFKRLIPILINLVVMLYMEAEKN